VNSADALFPKSHRLLKPTDFNNLRKDFKKKFSGPFLLIFKRNDLDHSRLGIAVTKKSANAVYRNRVKRIVRNTFRNNNIKRENFDLLVIFNKSKKVKNLDISKLSVEVESLFSQVMS
jgi:ribonuclease P protein component